MIYEGTMDTVIETNYFTRDSSTRATAGIECRASSTVIRYNKVVGGMGMGVDLDGPKFGNDQYGTACKVREDSYCLEAGIPPACVSYALPYVLERCTVGGKTLLMSFLLRILVFAAAVISINRHHNSLPFQVYFNILKRTLPAASACMWKEIRSARIPSPARVSWYVGAHRHPVAPRLFVAEEMCILESIERGKPSCHLSRWVMHGVCYS